MIRIALLVPLCSRGQSYTAIEVIPLLTQLYPSFLKTSSPGYKYEFYLGYDDDDIFYRIHHDDLVARFTNEIVLSGCQHAPARAWNELFKVAYHAGCDYFFQVGDDITIQTPGWTERFIAALESHKGLGVVGPCDPHNYKGRIELGRRIVTEVSFVSRVHYDIHQTYFHPAITNWYCDDWISEIYRNTTRIKL